MDSNKIDGFNESINNFRPVSNEENTEEKKEKYYKELPGFDKFFYFILILFIINIIFIFIKINKPTETNIIT